MRDFKQLPEAHPVGRAGRFYPRDASWGVAVPGDPALALDLDAFCAPTRVCWWRSPRPRCSASSWPSTSVRPTTVALSYAEDAELDGLVLGGELHPFQRAGVRYALERRRTFIADEQGLGKTVQALAALESEGAFPAAVVCPASMKLVWQRETRHWLPGRSVEVLDGRIDSTWSEEAERAELVVLNYDILDAHLERLAGRGLRALVLDESHYVKNPRAQRTKAALELAGTLPDDALRLALTGTPVLNRAEELIGQLRVLGRLGEFGSGARLTRRFRGAGSDDRLHWNLRATCYVRRTKQQVLPQLPSKRHDTVPVLLSNEQEYRLAEQDVVAWLQSLPLDLGTIDAKVAAALRSEQLVRLNNLRQLAATGKLPTALAWIDDFLASGEPLVVFAEHIAMQRAVIERFPGAAHILGADTTANRQRAVDAFQREDGPQLIVCSLKAASQGITLTRASNVAFLELDWTPARHDQAEDRLHRIGQESAVTAWYLLAPDTIDEMMAGAGAQAQPDRRDHRRPGARRGACGRRGHPRAARPALPAPARRRLRWIRARRRSWSTRSSRSATGIRTRAGRSGWRATSRSTRPTGATSPATIPSWPAAGSAWPPWPAPPASTRRRSHRSGPLPAGRSSCGATATTRTIRTRWRCIGGAGAEQVGFVPRELAVELAPELDEGTEWSALCLREQRRSPRSRAPGSRCCSGAARRSSSRGQSRTATLSLTAWIWRWP